MNRRLAVFGVIGFSLLILAGCRSATTPTPAPTQVSLPDMVATMMAEATPSATLPPAQPTLAAQAATQPPVLPTLEVQPTSTPAEVKVVSAPAECSAEALFVQDVTIPDLASIEPGTGFVKTWRLRNTGTCAWNGDYRLVFRTGEAMAGDDAILLPPAQPGDTVDVSVNMTAPAQGGVYTSFWQVTNSDGATVSLRGTTDPRIWVTIQVPVRVASVSETILNTGPATVPANNPAPAQPPSNSTPASQNPAAPSQPQPVPAPAACAGQIDIAFTQRLIELINQERTSRGLPALRVDQQLTLAALDHTLDMACNNFVEHYGSDGSTWFTRIQARGYPYAAAFENVAAGNPAFGGSADWVVEILWMNSQVHRENILNPNVTDIGVGYITNPAAKYVGYVTVNFAKK